MKAGIATAARMPMIATTIINSIRVTPRCAFLGSFMSNTSSNGCAVANLLDPETGSRAAGPRLSLCGAKRRQNTHLGILVKLTSWPIHRRKLRHENIQFLGSYGVVVRRCARE